MSVLFTDCMTVYNYHRDEDTGKETWKRTVVRGIQWRHGKKGINITDGAVVGSSLENITIDCGHEYGNKPYVDAATYARMPEEERAACWTLDVIRGQDVLVCGATEQDVDEQYRIKDLMRDHADTGIVVNLSDNRNRPRLKQIKVEAKR